MDCVRCCLVVLFGVTKAAASVPFSGLAGQAVRNARRADIDEDDMKMLRLGFLTALSVLFLAAEPGLEPIGAGYALAQGTPPAPTGEGVAPAAAPTSAAPTAAAQRVRTDSQGRRITVLDFNEANIEGSAKAPDGFVLRLREGAKLDSILELRKNFHKRVRSGAHEGLQAVPMR